MRLIDGACGVPVYSEITHKQMERAEREGMSTRGKCRESKGDW